MIPLATRIFVAGHRGLVGSALVRRLLAEGTRDLLLRSHAELDLCDAAATRAFFAAERPEVVLLAAARVGGIAANAAEPWAFSQRNLAIALNVIGAARENGCGRLLFLGSSCIYPKLAPQPIAESALLTGPLEASNRPYAIAKIAGIELCWAANREHGCRFLAAMPTNLYGPGDNYHPQASHVIPGLIRRLHEAKQRGDAETVIWGSGEPLREFLHADDLAAACVHLMGLPDSDFDALLRPGDPAGSEPPMINIGSDDELSIAELARRVAHVVGYGGRLVQDRSRPDGTPRKRLDSTRMRATGWRPRIALEDGLREVYRDFLARGCA